MSYKVIHAFTDLQDGGHVYLVGDKFPHNSKEVTWERINELSSCKNKVGKPLIKKELNDFTQHINSLEECRLPVASVPNKQYTKTEINRMPTADLREIALNTGVENAETMTGAELKRYLINVFGL